MTGPTETLAQNLQQDCKG